MESVKSLIVAGIIILIIVAGGIFFYSRSTSLSTNAKSQVITQTSQVTTRPSSQAKQNSGEQDIILTPGGFSPNVINVKVGTRVKWINNSGVMGEVDSDPHPTHTSYPPMNFAPFSNGSSVELVFDKAGTYHYHNHLNPSQTGTIVVN